MNVYTGSKILASHNFRWDYSPSDTVRKICLCSSSIELVGKKISCFKIAGSRGVFHTAIDNLHIHRQKD